MSDYLLERKCALSEQVQDKLVMLNGLRFHYRDWGDAHAPVIVALHGGTANAHGWDVVASALCDRWRWLALDQRGHGETEWASEYSVGHMESDVQAFVRAMGLTQFILIGHSMGGAVAYNYAASHRDQIERLVIIDMAPDVSPAFDRRNDLSMQANDIFDSPEQVFQTMRARNQFASDDELRRRAMHNLMQNEDGKWTWRYDRALRGDGKLKRPKGEPQWQLLSTITCPTLLIKGAESDLLAPETVERMVRTIPNCRVVEIPRAGHTVTADNPDAFIAALGEFLHA